MYNKETKLITTLLFFLAYLYNVEKGLRYYFNTLYYGLKEYDNAVQNTFQPPEHEGLVTTNTTSMDTVNYVVHSNFAQPSVPTTKSVKRNTNNTLNKIAFLHLEEKNIEITFKSTPTCTKQRTKNCITHFITSEIDYVLPKPNYLQPDFKSIIILLQNPIDLFISWYTSLYTSSKNDSRLKIRFQKELSRCYKDMNAFAVNGLRSRVIRVRPRIRSCVMRCWFCMLGDYRVCKVLKSYDIFIKEVLRLNSSEEKELYVLRLDHRLSKDVQKLEKRFGRIHISHNPHIDKKPIDILTKKGLENICHHLCEEIQLYKMLINQASNLKNQEKSYTMQQLKESCPIQYMQNNCSPIHAFVPSQILQVYNKSNKVLHYSITNRNIAFIHIGKTGGTTASKMIRRQCTFSTAKACAKHIAVDEWKSIPEKETQISKQVQEYYHTRQPDITKYNSFIISTRHPIDRMISWFIHEHPKNHLLQWNKLEDVLHLFECYNEVDDLATVGLHPQLSQDNEARKCQILARNYVTGHLKGSQHAQMNYNFYTHDLLFRNSTAKEIFVLRTNYFWKDWESINNLLGGGSNTTKEIKHFTHRARREHIMAVTNRTVSQDGLINFCRFLCSEIQLYKELIARAVNLEAVDKEISLSELKETCPTEATVFQCL